MQFELNKFQDEGYSGPYNLFDNKDCEKILEKIKTILGNNVLLWGSHFIDQKPDKQHMWHLDVEFGSWNGLTVWIGLKNLNEKTPVSLITYSHLINSAPRELKEKYKVDILDDNAILDEAKKYNPNCELKKFYLKPGEFIIWSGRVWHKTSNMSNQIRNSMILQYCSTENYVKIPEDFNYPDTSWSEKKPPCILISGQDSFKKNKILLKQDVQQNNTIMNKFKTKFIYKVKNKLTSFYKKFVNK